MGKTCFSCLLDPGSVHAFVVNTASGCYIFDYLLCMFCIDLLLLVSEGLKPFNFINEALQGGKPAFGCWTAGLMGYKLCLLILNDALNEFASTFFICSVCLVLRRPLERTNFRHQYFDLRQLLTNVRKIGG
jgi:hypothetical protein